MKLARIAMNQARVTLDPKLSNSDNESQLLLHLIQIVADDEEWKSINKFKSVKLPSGNIDILMFQDSSSITFINPIQSNAIIYFLADTIEDWAEIMADHGAETGIFSVVVRDLAEHIATLTTNVASGE